MVACPAAGRRNRGAPAPFLLAPLVGALVVGTARWSLSFAAGLRDQGARGSLLARSALNYDEPIRRRDGFVQENMQRWIKQQTVVVKREMGVRGDSDTEKAQERKAAYLKKLGLGNKIAGALGPKPAWHLEHVRAGDVLEGFFSHPDIDGGDRLDLSFTATSDTAGTWSSEKGGFENDVEIRQDFPIAFEAGPQQDMDMTSYIFNKFNMKWRDFEKSPYPTADELEHISLKGMQMWFKQVAEVEGFPDEETFASSCADASKGMSKEEFLDFIRADDPDYIKNTFANVFTGRRMNLVDAGEGQLVFDGDFTKEAENHIFGYVTFAGRPGGTFELILRKEQAKA
jgi:hypothetical protein|mmetsp:Transcript_34164/g.101495  ORF Transcript_34164/g.101495 Transcript_34164/m.101495 type:complete len:342 (-) Transcript_34164:49-1074(-)